MSTAPGGGTWWRSEGWPIPVWIHSNAPYLSHAGHKVSEMMAPNVPPFEMRAPGPRKGLGALEPMQPINGSTPAGPTPVTQSAGAVPAATPTPQSSQPVFTDTSGKPITSAVCGSIYNMTIPGWEGRSPYILQTKNGAPQFSGTMLMPMGNYASHCNQDEGSYQLQAFDPTSGALIGQTNFTVLPATSASTAPSSTATTGATTSPATGLPGFFSTLTTAQWLLIAAVGIVLLSKMK